MRSAVAHVVRMFVPAALLVGITSIARAGPIAVDLSVRLPRVVPGSAAIAVNNQGQVVVNACVSSWDYGCHAFLWTQTGGMIDLGSFGGMLTQAWAINAAGQIVGTSQDASGTHHAFLWTPGEGMTDLGAAAYPTDVSDTGVVVGAARRPNGFDYAFLWAPLTGMTDLGSLGGEWAHAFAVSNNGKYVAGYARTEGAIRPFVWTEAHGMTEIAVPAASRWGIARSVNDDGLVVGGYDLNGVRRAFLWTAASGIMEFSAAFPEGSDSDAGIVNDAGQVMGGFRVPGGSWRTFLWSEGVGITDLGTVSGAENQGVALSDDGRVAGNLVDLDLPGDGPFHAFLWTETAGMVTLGALGGQRSTPRGVNTCGWVVGAAEGVSGYPDERAVVWKTDAACEIESLASMISSAGLPFGIVTSFASKLSGAAAAIRIADIDDACGYMKAFGNEAEALNGRGPTEYDFGEALTRAQEIRAILECR